jgi:O-acetyl-ADP-ribose deacetylase (regulator of RNase III)
MEAPAPWMPTVRQDGAGSHRGRSKGADRSAAPCAHARVLQVADELGATTISTPAISAGTFGFPLETAADVALRTVSDHLLGETGIERVTFVLRPDAVEAFRRRLATI